MNLVLLALALAVADGGDSSAAYTLVGADDRAELERGEWRIVGLLRAGAPVPEEQLKRQDMRLAFKGERLAFTRGGGKAEAYEFKLNPNGKPKQLDWTLPTAAGSPQ